MMSKILIIDDDHHILIMVKAMLERAGFKVELASNGVEGLIMFKKTPFDLVITDIIMPEKEGLETMSGGGKISINNYLGTAKIFGATKILEKPFTRKEMVSAVRELIGAPAEISKKKQ